jgi:hypothetical protein
MIVAVFKCEIEAISAVEELERAGVDRAQIGVLTTSEHGSAPGAFPASDVPYDPVSAGEAKGAWIGGLGYLGAASAAGVVILSGGGLGLALAALLAAGSAGGVIGALVASGFHALHAELVNAELEAGGLAIWVKPRTPEQADIVQRLLAAHTAVRIVENAAAAPSEPTADAT